METLLILAAVIIVALIVIALDQASQLELERALHRAERNLWLGKEAVYETTQKFTDAILDAWEARAAREDQAVSDTESRRFIEEFFSDRDWDAFEDGQDSYEADEFGFCLSCGANHEQEDAEEARATADYKQAEDVVVNNVSVANAN